MTTKSKDLSEYGTKTIDELIQVLQYYKKKIGGDKKVFLSDVEFNGKQTMFEVSLVQGDDNLFLFYEMHEGTWDLEVL